MASPAQRANRIPRLSRVDLFRLLSDPDRLRILALCEEDELSVGELATVLDDSQPQVSRKVAPLRAAGLLEARRDGTRTFLKTRAGDGQDAVLADALKEGRRLCQGDGSLARVSEVVAAREEAGVALFAAEPGASPTLPPDASRTGQGVAGSNLHVAHLAALSPLLPARQLAVDVGTGDGLLLEVLAPLYERVIALDRSQARLAQCAARVRTRGFRNVSLVLGSFEEGAVLERVDRLGGADLVFSSRTLHHVARPAQALAACARLLKKGGALALLDYLPHDDEAMRRDQGDVWLGFSREEHCAQLERLGLQEKGYVVLPPSFHAEGPDAHLSWHALVAQRPFDSSSAVDESPVTSNRSSKRHESPN